MIKVCSTQLGFRLWAADLPPKGVTGSSSYNTSNTYGMHLAILEDVV